jgi:CBS domain containing-hemolysin-like protein
MEWLIDPTLWLGLTTLVLLEIVLGVDNLVFIAIVADKLPPGRRKPARQLGLGLALVTRLLLLAGVFWMTTLTRPIFSAFGHPFSSRDLILLGGGLFLLLKATIEIHERLEGAPVEEQQGREAAAVGFGGVVAQIVALDAIFSVDSILTAVGMTNQIGLMMAAVIIAIGVMLVASKPLSDFVNAHPPLIILCLGFLLMIGLSLVADSVGFHIPKGYLYAAIGFSVVIESFNQIALRNRQRWIARTPRRQRVAEAVLRLLGGVPDSTSTTNSASTETLVGDSAESAFVAVEKEMVHGILELADRPVSSIMTPRHEVAWVDLEEPQEQSLAAIKVSRHSQLLVGQGSLDRITGILRKEELLTVCLDGTPIDIRALTRPAVMVYRSASILSTLELFKREPVHAAVVVDEYGALQGVVTQTDLLEAIAGDLPDPANDGEPEVVRRSDDSFTLDGAISVYELKDILGLGQVPKGDYQTLAGFALSQLGRIPSLGEGFDFGGWHFEIAGMQGARISKVLATKRADAEEAPHQ